MVTCRGKAMKQLCQTIFIISVFALAACNKPTDEESKEHFLSDQQRALERAQDVNKVILDAEQKKRQQLQEMER